MKRLILILALFLMISVSSHATIYYVDGDNGSDAGGAYDGLSETYAFATIQQAVTTASTDDIIYVQNNGSTVYTETVTITDEDLRLIGYGSALEDGTSAVIDGEDTRTNGILIQRTSTSPTNPNAVSIVNFDVIQATGDGILMTRTSGLGSNVFINVVSRDNGGAGIMGNGSVFCVAYNCAFVSNNTYGIKAYDAIMSNCLAGANTNQGFWIKVGGVFNCVATANGDDGFFVGDDTAFVANCIADSNTDSGFRFYSSAAGLFNSVAIRNGAYGVNSDKVGVSVGCYFGSSSYANTTAASNNTLDLSESTLSADPFTAIYDSSTNPTWSNWDYRVTSGSALFDVLQPVGGLDNLMQAYASIGPKVQNPAGGSGAIVISPRRHGN